MYVFYNNFLQSVRKEIKGKIQNFGHHISQIAGENLIKFSVQPTLPDRQL